MLSPFEKIYLTLIKLTRNPIVLMRVRKIVLTVVFFGVIGFIAWGVFGSANLPWGNSKTEKREKVESHEPEAELTSFERLMLDGRVADLQRAYVSKKFSNNVSDSLPVQISNIEKRIMIAIRICELATDQETKSSWGLKQLSCRIQIEEILQQQTVEDANSLAKLDQIIEEIGESGDAGNADIVSIGKVLSFIRHHSLTEDDDQLKVQTDETTKIFRDLAKSAPDDVLIAEKLYSYLNFVSQSDLSAARPFLDAFCDGFAEAKLEKIVDLRLHVQSVIRELD